MFIKMIVDVHSVSLSYKYVSSWSLRFHSKLLIVHSLNGPLSQPVFHTSVIQPLLFSPRGLVATIAHQNQFQRFCDEKRQGKQG
jgi:hypothetical protein